MKNLYLFSLLAASLLISACTTNNGHYSVITTKPLSLYDLTSPAQVVANDASGSSDRHVAVVIPSSRMPTIAQAIDQVLEQYSGDYLKDVDVTHRSFQLMWLYHYSAWEINGDVVKIRR